MKKFNKVMLILFLSLIILSSLYFVSAFPTPKKINDKFMKALNSPQREDTRSDIQLILPKNPDKIVEDLDKYLDLDLTENKKKDLSKKLEKDIYPKYLVIDNTDQFLLDLENSTDIKLEKEDIEKIKEKLKELKKTPLINDVIGERGDNTLIAKSSPEIKSEPYPDETAPFLGGSTAVIIVFVNQPGEDWEMDYSSDIQYMGNEVLTATDWMTNQAPVGSSLDFTVGYYVTNIITIPQDFPNINDDIWTEEAMQSLGFSDQDNDGSSIDEMLNFVKNELSTNNAVAIFVPHMEGRAYARVYGPPYTVIWFYDFCFIFCSKEEYPTVAHETLHLFGADDEYYQEHDGTGCGANSCWEPVPFSYEPLQALYANGNCERCNPNSVDCIMKNHNVIKSNPNAIEYYTKGQIGWWDYDGDGIVDPFDNCIINSNPSQIDTDGDGFGDACDTDYDDDGILNENDNCPFAYNPLQENNDEDSQGDACDPDDDNDGIEDSFDECSFTPGIDYYSGCPDTFAPNIYSSSVSLGDNQPGGIITITTYAYDPSGINYIFAEVENPDENVITTLTLYDDGAHGDKDPEDGIYANIWATADEGTYLVDFLTEDNTFNSDVFNNFLRFSTETFTSSSRILLIYDDSTDFYTYYQDALTANNFPFDYYNTFEKGNPYSSLFYNYDLIIWATGNDWTSTLTKDDQINLQNYLDNGGTLFLSGQDIGFDIGNSDFYSDYLHAQYVQDDSNFFNLDGISSDPISDGLSLTIVGEGGADNQRYPSEIDPINNAQSIFIYNPVVVDSPILSEKNPSNQKEEYEMIFGELDKDISEAGEIISSGTGAISYDNDIYKLIYFAFGFEAINNDSVRTELMKRIIDWFDILERNVLITAMLDPSTPEPIAGKQVIINVTLKNTGDLETTYNISLNGTEEWANVTAIESMIITLDINESKDVKIYLDLNDDSVGEQGFTVTVDYDGKTTEQQISMMIYDRTPPEITILSPLNNSWYNSDGISINVYTDEISKWIKTSLDSETLKIYCEDCDGTTISSGYGPVGEGFHTFTVYASDYADNIANKTVEFYIDTIKPELNLTAHNMNLGSESNLVGPNSPAIINYEVNDENFYYGVLAIGNLIDITEDSEDVEGLVFLSYLQNVSSGNLTWNAKQYRLSNGEDEGEIIVVYQMEDGIYEVEGRLCWSSGESFSYIDNKTNIPPMKQFSFQNYDGSLGGGSGGGGSGSGGCGLTTARFNSDTLEFINFSDISEYDENSIFYYYSNNDSYLNISVKNGLSLIEEDVKDNEGFDVYFGAVDMAYNIDYKIVSLITDMSAPILEETDPVNGSKLNKFESIIFKINDLNGVDNENTEVLVTLNNEDFLGFVRNDSLENQIILNMEKAKNGEYIFTLTLKDILNNSAIYEIFIEDINLFEDVETNIPNLTFESNDIPNETLKEINFKENNNSLVSFKWDYNLSELDFSLININEQDENATEGSLIISGIDLTSQNQTKTVYLNKIAGGTGLCIKDDEITSISEISDACNEENETWIACPGNNGNYTCELATNETQYKISGLVHSGVKEQETYCRDGIVNGNEECEIGNIPKSCSDYGFNAGSLSCTATCTIDSSGCYTQDTGGGGGSGEDGGSSDGRSSKRSSSTTTTTTTTKTTEEIPEEEIEEEPETQKLDGAGITGAVIGGILDKGKDIIAIIFIVLIAGGVVGMWIWRRKNKAQVVYAPKDNAKSLIEEIE